MAKSGELSVFKRNIKTYKNHKDMLLTREVASEMAKIVRRGDKLYTTEQWAKNQPLVFELTSGVVEIKPKAYNRWISEHVRIPGSLIVFRDYMNAAKNEGWQERHKKQQQEMVKKAQRDYSSLQKLPLGTSSKLTRTKSRFNTEGKKVITGEETEEMSIPLDPRMISEKRRGAEFVLSRLDPSYAEKKENKNLNIIVSLKDLRKAAEAKKSIQQPHE